MPQRCHILWSSIEKVKLPRTVVAVLAGFFQQALAIRAPTSSAAFATAALEFRTASCALTHRRLSHVCARELTRKHSPTPSRSLSLSLSLTILCQHERVSATSEGLRPCGAWLHHGYIVGVFQGVLTVAAALETWFSRVLCCFLCTMVRAYIRSHAVCI